MWDDLIKKIKDAGGDVEKFAGDILSFAKQVWNEGNATIDTGSVALDTSTPENTPTVQAAKKTSTRKPAKAKPVIIKWSISKWKVKNGTWTTQPILTVNGQQFTYPTPQGYIDKFIALKGIRAYVRFDTNITKFQAALKVWGVATQAPSAATTTPAVTQEITQPAEIGTAQQVVQQKIAIKIENPIWNTSGDMWTTQAVLTIYYNAPYNMEVFRGTTPADYIAKLRSLTPSEINKPRVERYIQEFQQAQNYWNLEILNRQLRAQQAAEAATEMQMPPAPPTAAPSTAQAVTQPPTAVQFQPNAYPKTVAVNVDTLRVRSAPYSTAALAGSQYLHNGDQFIVTGYVTGENVDGENRWWTSQFGNYVWVGGTEQKP